MGKENLIYGWMIIWILGLKFSGIIGFGTSIFMMFSGMLLTVSYTLIKNKKED